jgi:hypothetical protein
MAESKSTMVRLAQLERDVGDIKESLVRIGAILLDHRVGIERLQDRLQDSMRRVDQRFDLLERSLGERLDRLIAVTTLERTQGYERLAERRLTKLEERAGS